MVLAPIASSACGDAMPAATHFERAGQAVVTTPTVDGFTVVLADGASREPLPGEIGRHGNVALVSARGASPRLARELAQAGRVYPTYRVAGSVKARYVTPYLYARPASGTSPQALDAWLARNGLELVSHLYLDDWVYVRTEKNPIDVARALVATGEATASEPSFFVGTKLHGLAPTIPNDPYFAEEWQLHNNGPFTSTDGKGVITGGDHAHIAEAWALLARLGKAASASVIGENVRLGIIDDGFDLAHEDLASKFVASKNFGGAVEVGNLFSATTPKDFHGTLVTGIAAAVAGNGVGIAGACPGCKLIGARMGTDTPSGMTPDQYYDQIFTWVMAQNPDVINCSWGPDDTVATSYYDALIERITTTGRGGKGTSIVFASGNDGADFAWNALASNPKSISVGASDSTGKRRSFSNFGAGLDLVAPTSGAEKSGIGITTYTDRIWSTDNYVRPACLAPGATPTSSCSDAAGWTPTSPQAGGDKWVGMYSFRFSHTSAAAPVVSGVVGVMLHANPNLSASQVQSILQQTADEVSPADASYGANGFSTTYGYGRVNALRAVAAAYEIGGGVLDVTTKSDIDTASPCTRASCGGAIDAGAPATVPDASSGGGSGSGGATSAGGSSGSGGATSAGGSSGSGGTTTTGGTADGEGETSTDGPSDPSPAASSGCAIAATPARPSMPFAVVLATVLIASRRRRRVCARSGLAAELPRLLRENAHDSERRRLEGGRK